MESSPSEERVATLIRQGQAAAQAGQQELARRYLNAAVDLAPDSAVAWLWLAGVQEPAEARESLLTVLRLDPDNRRARAGLAWVEQQLAEAPPRAAPRDTGPFSSPATGTAGLFRTGPISSRDVTGSLGPSTGRAPDPTGPLRRPAEVITTEEYVARPRLPEQELREQLRGAQPEPLVEVAGDEERPAGRRGLRRRRGARAAVEASAPLDPGTRLHRSLFQLLVLFLVVGIVVLLMAMMGYL